jgi:hypothetical protein
MKSADILYHITVAGKPSDLVETSRGQVAYDQWLAEEKARIVRKSGWPVEIYTNPKTGEISLVHLKVTQRP